jgi:hypothetical protein
MLAVDHIKPLASQLIQPLSQLQVSREVTCRELLISCQRKLRPNCFISDPQLFGNFQKQKQRYDNNEGVSKAGSQSGSMKVL